MQNQEISAESSFAQVLRNKRLEKKLSLKQVSDSLKLPPDRLEELEQKTSLESLDPFERGHLRNYAALLDVDLSPFILSKSADQNYSSKLKPVQQKGLNVKAPENSRRVYWAVVWVVVLVAGYFLVTGLLDSNIVENVGIPSMNSESLMLEPRVIENQNVETD
ncbi:MAG: helix-turn-helix domain-containing protein [Thiomicrospira sp.]|uniref:helix-turn-helix domain-containing protein n=1 Tax=Thiomicrospira sp. TaxID=935 RepID=UPI0019FE7536|nr:helix-turn-helix transcriptional regulator [Thiomicrospira sp.]MBE0492903.1 helix-turn-helix domain-containing protein [Thiomicrospira sp.]